MAVTSETEVCRSSDTEESNPLWCDTVSLGV